MLVLINVRSTGNLWKRHFAKNVTVDEDGKIQIDWITGSSPYGTYDPKMYKVTVLDEDNRPIPTYEKGRQGKKLIGMYGKVNAKVKRVED